MTIIPNENEEIEFKEKEQFELPVFTEQQAREDEFKKSLGGTSSRTVKNLGVCERELDHNINRNPLD